ncbi:uncharacterized protein SPPG_04367 [Spizellomyces punctatus DAOM BR117]|uniref:Exonuclease domain-containing protein n=1 Tax=Spizellomyces punctatus (strain DAOM BR117) TaxID=645134 RepID=A0A0L0HEX8_SPIPD|nr:uncharacterized protein SPPG_04367 [Spizellomyces punctatus DAOM BR117]KND00021.1 hypothetical protein SPPG_04367 [Spizellomyces punctatus DAOM BR117]|eukprot:XP_016608060.1 hypothetical protein SPPG_04367 [Spizellomyces punctatus DAOM BR117]
MHIFTPAAKAKSTTDQSAKYVSVFVQGSLLDLISYARILSEPFYAERISISESDVSQTRRSSHSTNSTKPANDAAKTHLPSHTNTIPRPAPDTTEARRPSSITKDDTKAPVPQPTSRKRPTPPTALHPVEKRLANEKTSPLMAALASRGYAYKSGTTVPVKQDPPSALASSNRARPHPQASVTHIVPGQAPILGPDLHSRIPRTSRQKALTKYYAEFCRIYAPLLAEQPTLAQEHAFKQEAAVMAKATQPVAVSLDDIGIDGEWTPPSVTVGEPPEIPMAELEKLLTSTEQLRLMGYPFPPDEAEPQITYEDNQEQQQTCDRCGSQFIPTWPLDEGQQVACRYHWANLRSVVQGGAKERLYVCCQEKMGAPGCVRGAHVFKDEDTVKLDRWMPFVRLPEASRVPKAEKVVALDCEMSYTTSGMELTRLTAVNWHGKPILDELVRTTFPVLDLNSRWSGISSLEDAKYDLNGITDLLGQIMGRDTILIGHGLENDLKAMRIYHTKIIDTAAIFPHPQGLPRRYPLRFLCQKLLGRFIQQSTTGHDSLEDARTSLELVKLKLEKGDNLYL